MFEELIKRLQEEGLGHLARQLEGQAKPSIRLSTTRVDERDLPRNASRIGGRPDLSDQQTWPMNDGTPMQFLAQISLSELPRIAHSDLLPDSGLLSFFYDEESGAWGFDPKDRGSWRVLFFSADLDTCQRRSRPVAEGESRQSYGCCAASFHPDTTWPSSEHQEYSQLTIAEADLTRFYEIEDQLVEAANETSVHRMFGFADQVQGEMRLECQLVSHGLYCGDGSGYSDPRAKALEGGALDWELLLQIDSVDDAGMVWGDCGRIYFWIRRADLLNADFDQTWMCLQCY